jgi:transposase-like protein
MNASFIPVRCPCCDYLLFEAGPGFAGLTRHKCKRCRKRVWVSGNGAGHTRTGMVDAPQVRMAG